MTVTPALASEAVATPLPESESPHSPAPTASADRTRRPTLRLLSSLGAPAPNSDIAVSARNLHLHSRRGRVYGPLDLTIPTGTLTVVTGRSGSGKTALLLTLAGRLRPGRGSELTVLGHVLPLGAIRVQHVSSAMGMAGLDDLDDEVSVQAAVRERFAWLAPWWKPVHRPSDEAIARICAPAFGDRTAPTGKTIVHSLDEVDNLLLRISLALLTDPQLIVVDNLDQLHDSRDRDLVWDRLHALTASGLTVIGATSSSQDFARLGWDAPPQTIDLSTDKDTH